MGCCVARDDQYNLNVSPKNENNRNYLFNSKIVTPSKNKPIQFTISNIENENKDAYLNQPSSSKVFNMDNDSKYESNNNKKSFCSSNNKMENLNSNLEKILMVDQSKKYGLRNQNYVAKSNHDSGMIFQDYLLSNNKLIQKGQTNSSLNDVIPNLRESLKDYDKKNNNLPSELITKKEELENPEYRIYSPTRLKNHRASRQSNLEVIQSFQGDSLSKNQFVSINEINFIPSERENIHKGNDSIKPYLKKEIIVIRKENNTLRDNKNKVNRLKEKAYENGNYNSWNNISQVNKKDNSLIESKFEDFFNLQDISAISNRDVLNKYIHLFGDIELYPTNNSKSVRSFYESHRDDVDDGDITNIKNTNVSASNIQIKLQRLNDAMNRRQQSLGKIDVNKKSDINFNSDLFNKISKSLQKKNI